jgi:hypothetical protein
VSAPHNGVMRHSILRRPGSAARRARFKQGPRPQRRLPRTRLPGSRRIQPSRNGGRACAKCSECPKSRPPGLKFKVIQGNSSQMGAFNDPSLFSVSVSPAGARARPPANALLPLPPPRRRGGLVNSLSVRRYSLRRASARVCSPDSRAMELASRPFLSATKATPI